MAVPVCRGMVASVSGSCGCRCRRKCGIRYMGKDRMGGGVVHVVIGALGTSTGKEA